MIRGARRRSTKPCNDPVSRDVHDPKLRSALAYEASPAAEMPTRQTVALTYAASSHNFGVGTVGAFA
jgi:hypothetical protein